MSVEITDDQDVPIDLKRLESRLLRGLESAGCSDSELSVLLTDDRRIAELNAAYRDQPNPTDVLSFPQDDSEDLPSGGLIGDIVISIPTARVQAKEAGISLDEEVEYLAFHGLLHLLGHDHETEGWENWERVLGELRNDG